MRKVALVSLGVFTLLWGGALGLVACGGDDTTNNNPDGSTGNDANNQPDNNNNPDTNPGTDSGGDTGRDTGGGDGGDGGGGKAYFAEVIALATSVTVNGNATLSHSGSVSLGPASAFSVPGATCPGTKVGSCCYIPAASSDAGTDAGEAGAPLSAGNITISNGDSGADGSTVTLTPPDYTEPTPFPLTWAGGDQLAVTAAGADIHAFSGPLVTSADFANVQPPLVAFPAMTVDHTAAFTITWTAENKAAEQALLFFSGTQADNTPIGVAECVVAESTGTITVDATIVGHFAAGDKVSILLDRGVPNIISSDDNATVYLVGASATVGVGTFN